MEQNYNVQNALQMLSKFLRRTPVIYSKSLSQMLGHDIYFKMDALQKTGSFKVRGCLYHLLELKNQGRLPSKVVSYSTGNHAIGLAYATKIMGVHARIYLPKNVANIKKQVAKSYGAEVIETQNRQIAEQSTFNDASSGFYHLSPSNSELTVTGSATMCYEALDYMRQQEITPSAIFASCGAGGLLSGSYMAKSILSPSSMLIGVEPEIAGDAYESVKNSKIHKFKLEPETIADGLRSLSVAEFCFPFLQKLDDFLLATEDQILYWSAWLNQLLKVTCEPSCAVAMAGAHQWLKKQKERKKVLILISGGNVDQSMWDIINKEAYLDNPPSSK